MLPSAEVRELSPSLPCDSGAKAPTMLGSIPTSTSSSGWLDRLRTSKGFPIPSHLDLEHFLHSNFKPNPNPTPPEGVGPPASNSPIHRKQQQSHNTSRHEKEQRLFDLMNNVLSELFVMGDPRESAAGRKSARKQITPRICLASASASADVGASRQVPAMSPSSADNSITEEKRDRRKMKRMRASAEHGVGSDPSLNIGTVVTVIDTSSPGWKSEKHFRKGMSWKGREKKMWNVCRKKRKMGLVEKLIVEKEPLTELKGREQKDNVKSHTDEYELKGRGKSMMASLVKKSQNDETMTISGKKGACSQHRVVSSCRTVRADPPPHDRLELGSRQANI